MTIVYILAGIILLGVIIFRMGGKELDRRLTAVGGLRKMYAPLIDGLSLLKTHRLDLLSQGNWMRCSTYGRSTHLTVRK